MPHHWFRFLRMILRLVAAISLALWVLPVAAAKQALVIGNAAYTSLEPLQNTIPDAQGYRAAFEALGYEVQYHTDLDELALEEAVISFVDGIAPGDEVAFVFSGHGWSADGINYLIPTDAPRQGSERLLARRSLPLKNGVNGVLDDIAAQGAALSLAIIDACRDNPFATNGTRSIGNARGLAQVTPRKGSFVIYSAGEGQTALDRFSDDPPDQQFSVFTRHFLPLLTSGLYVEDAISEAQVKVSMAAQSAGHDQQPAYYDQTLGKTCLTRNCRGTAPDAAPVTDSWMIERPVPEGVYLFGERAPLVTKDGSRFYWPVTTQKKPQGFGELVEVFDQAGRRVSAFVPEDVPMAHGLTPDGQFHVIGADQTILALSETGGVVKRTSLSRGIDLITKSQALASGKMRLFGAIAGSLDDAIFDVDLGTGVVSEPVWTTTEFLFDLRFSESGHFANASAGQIQLFAPDGTELGVVERDEGNWTQIDFDLSPLGLFQLQWDRGTSGANREIWRLRHRDWLGSVLDHEFEVDRTGGQGWEVLSMTADALGIVVVAVLDASSFELRRFNPFGDSLAWRAVLPWDRDIFGPPIGVTQLSDGGAALVQYPYLPEGETSQGDLLRLTRIGPRGEVPDAN